MSLNIPTKQAGDVIASADFNAVVSAINANEQAIDGKQDTLTFDDAPTQNSTNPVKSGGVYTALGDKADKTNTYTKTEVDTALSGKVDKVTGKGLSTNDYTNDDKNRLKRIEQYGEDIMPSENNNFLFFPIKSSGQTVAYAITLLKYVGEIEPEEIADITGSADVRIKASGMVYKMDGSGEISTTSTTLSVNDGDYVAWTSIKWVKVEIDGTPIDYEQQKVDIVIPYEYNGLPVTKLGYSDNNADFRGGFSVADFLRSITIPKSIQTSVLGFSWDNNNLEKITMCGAINLESEFISTCPLLKEFRFAEGTEKIGNYSLSRCNTLHKIYIPDSVTKIGDFKGNASVSKINSLQNVSENTKYRLSDGGTLTLGNLEVVEGDIVNFTGEEWKTTTASAISNILNKDNTNIDTVYYVNQGSVADDWCQAVGATYVYNKDVYAVDNTDIEQKRITQSAPSAITLADNTEYYLSNVGSLTLTYPSGTHWQALIVLETASSGTVSITLPNTTKYIGSTPTFSNSETWEISIRDGVAVCGKAVSAS